MLLWLCLFPPAALNYIGKDSTLCYHVCLSGAGLGMLAQNRQSDDAVPELFMLPSQGSMSKAACGRQAGTFV
jgi:hypothetical protein